ncbi:hypothetical protein CIB93_16240 [Streptomyces sp. WZ.A104]|uniref:hypothetical protein n=1 Tax=Streptomyces sp. WZ.A104 TaxID=2023771 RepID=UPI000BBBFD61|nr:hypothetical protein [Streptomyces sp. WZ.A104]PCG85061.1 hypothetical protein CIB93_16240 [Streptomyces sp. WZ.A104]
MAELAWITLGKHRQLGLTASTVHDEFGTAHQLLLDAGFSTGHPDFAYVLGNNHPDEVGETLQQLYSAVASHYVAIDDALLDEGMSKNLAPPRGSEPVRQLAPAPRQPDGRADLAEFAEGLSARLPGSWTVAVHGGEADEGPIPLSERVWDYGHVSWALSELTTPRSAVLTSDSGIEFLVTDRPLREHEFLVAAFEPRSTESEATTKTPNGIVVSNDPVRAASRVTTRLLPRYQEAVREIRLSQVATSVTAGQRVLAEWDAVSDSLCDADHWPLDERYGLRQQLRDAEMWAQFAPFLEHGPALVAHAEETLPLLDPTERLAGRWAYRLHALHEALGGGARVQAEFQMVAEALLPDHPRSKAVFADAVAMRNAEGWHYSLTWMDNARVLVDIARADKAPPTPPTRPLRGQRVRSARADAARAWSPHAARQITAAIEKNAGPPAIRFFNSSRPPRSR